VGWIEPLSPRRRSLLPLGQSQHGPERRWGRDVCPHRFRNRSERPGQALASTAGLPDVYMGPPLRQPLVEMEADCGADGAGVSYETSCLNFHEFLLWQQDPLELTLATSQGEVRTQRRRTNLGSKSGYCSRRPDIPTTHD
jgi:hypothetical protein